MVNLSGARQPPIPDLSPMPVGNVILAAAPLSARFILRGVQSIEGASEAFGIPMPTVPCRSATDGRKAACWLGPDEWLLISPEAEAATLHRALFDTLAGVPHALVDVSHRQTALLVEGPGAASLLNAGAPLDLAIEAFPQGMVARTIFDKAEIVLWRTGFESFRVEVSRSFAPYVHALLEVVRDENFAPDIKG
jgi:sarcosine oxidase subunit gamma